MSLKEIIKDNTMVRRIGKQVKIYYEFLHDAKYFSHNYIEMAEKKGNYDYTIMLLVHSIEKGLCMNNPRPFGHKKILQLIGILDNITDTSKSCFEYRLGVEAVRSWSSFYENRNWINEDGYKQAKQFIAKVQHYDLNVGSKRYKPCYSEKDVDTIESVLLSRHAVRDFKNEKLKMDDIKSAMTWFLETPTACNRQMCKVYYIDNEKIKKILHETIVGISGFNKETVNYFIITYDVSAFAYSGERHQGMLNSGLCSMNFINGLHVRGIGTCCLQWSNKHSQDKYIHSLLSLKESERIALVIGAGYYLEESLIPSSVRKDTEDILKIVKE